MNNWVVEIKKWCPELRCVAIHGPHSERDRIKKAHEKMLKKGYNKQGAFAGGRGSPPVPPPPTGTL